MCDDYIAMFADNLMIVGITFLIRLITPCIWGILEVPLIGYKKHKRRSTNLHKMIVIPHLRYIRCHSLVLLHYQSCAPASTNSDDNLNIVYWSYNLRHLNTPHMIILWYNNNNLNLLYWQSMDDGRHRSIMNS